jgi:hypothetical protein
MWQPGLRLSSVGSGCHDSARVVGNSYRHPTLTGRSATSADETDQDQRPAGAQPCSDHRLPQGKTRVPFEGQFERLHPAWVLMEQVAQVGRWRLRAGDCQEHGRTAIMPETSVGAASKR